MFSVRQIAARQLQAKTTFSFAFGGNKRKPTPSDLDKYDVVVVGAHLGNVLATHLDAVVGEKQKIFVAFDNLLTSLTSERGLYEQGQYTWDHSASPSSSSVVQPAPSSARTTPLLTTTAWGSSTQMLTKLCCAMAGPSSMRPLWLQ